MAFLRRGVWLLVFVGALVGGWYFADNNAAPVRIDYWLGSFGAVPLWVALLASFGAGAGVAALAMFARLTRSSLAQRRYRKTVTALESEVHQLRNLPLEVDAERDLVESAPPVLAAGAGEVAEVSDASPPVPPVEVVR